MKSDADKLAQQVFELRSVKARIRELYQKKHEEIVTAQRELSRLEGEMGGVQMSINTLTGED